MSIREIIEKLWIDCNNIPDDGTIYDPIGVLQDQALAQIKTELIEKLPKEIKDEEKPGIESMRYFELYKIGFNCCLSQAIEIIQKA